MQADYKKDDSSRPRFYFRPSGTQMKTHREPENISRSCQKTKCIPRTINITVKLMSDEQHTCNIILSPYSSWEMDAAALKSLNYTNDRDSMFNHYPQTATQQPRTDL